MPTSFKACSYILSSLAILIVAKAPATIARELMQDDTSRLPSTNDVDYDGPYSDLIDESPQYQQVPINPDQRVDVIPDASLAGTNSEEDSIQPEDGSTLSRGNGTDRTAEVTGSCARQMSGRVVWALATAGGRNCAAACRGYNGAKNAALVAINSGTSSSPSYLCRTGDPSFKQNRAGFSQKYNGMATPCYAYARGGPANGKSSKILSGGRMNCACVADKKVRAFSGCSRPVWVSTKGGNCSKVCNSNGRRSAIRDSPGSPVYVCRPKKSMRIGWARAEGGKMACHFATNNLVTNAKAFGAASVYVFSYQCLCI